MFRLPTTFIALSLALGAAAQDFQKTIDYGPKTASAKVIAEELAKQTGVKLEVGGKLQNEVLFLKVKQRSLTELMDKIAEATNAEWVHERDVYRLTRSSPRAAAEEKASQEARISRVTLYQQQTLEAISKQPTWDNQTPVKLAETVLSTLTRFQADQAKSTDYKLVEDLAAQQPINRALLQVVATLNPAAIAKLPPDGRLVYATNPQASQLTIPSNMLRVIQDAVRDNNAYLSALSALQPPEKVRVYGVNSLRLPSRLDGNPASLGRALVSVDRWGEGDQFQIRLSVNDTEEKEVATHESYFMLPRIAPKPSTVKVSTEQNSKFDWSAETKEFIKAYSNASAIGLDGSQDYYSAFSLPDGSNVKYSGRAPLKRSSPISTALRAKLVDPVAYEPLGFAVTEIFSTLSDRTQDNVVALIPDVSFYPILWNMINRGDFTPNQFLAFSRDSFGIDPGHEKDWFVFKPIDPAAARAEGTNRETLRSLLRTVAQQDGISLKAIASFLTSQDHVPSKFSIDGAWLILQRPIDGSPLIDDIDSSYRLLRVMGSLLNNQGNLPSAPVAYGSLSRVQAGYVDRLVYSRSASMNVDRQVFSGGTTELARDKSEMFPNGIPRDALIEIASEGEIGVVGFDTTTDTKRFRTIRELVQDKIQSESPNLLQNYGQPQQFQKFQAAERSIYRLRMTLRPGVTMGAEFFDALPRLQGKPGSFAGLPAPVRKAYDTDLIYVQTRGQGGL